MKVTSCAICGSDLHLFHTFIPAMLPGDIMGHEMMGEVVADEPGAIAAVNRLASLSRRTVRERFEARFTARRMAEDYLRVYRSLAGESRSMLRAIA